MRIAFLCQEDIVRPQGGTGTYVRNVSIDLAGRGHDVHVIARRRADAPYEIVDGVHVHRVDAPGPPVLYSPLYFKASAQMFRKLHSHAAFDVMHGNLPLMSSFGVKGKNLPPIVETLHCTVREELRAISSQSVARLNPNEVLARALSPVWANRERYLLRRAGHIISVSEGLKREIVSQCGYPAESVTVVPNGVDSRRFAEVAGSQAGVSDEIRASLGFAPTDRIILYLGRLMERKRAGDLVQALPAILKLVPDARLLIVGKRNANAARIEALAAELGVAARVTLVDHVPYAQVPYYYAMASVYCLPSAYEGFPFTVLEAMACGTPVVASDISGIDEQIKHGENGLLHPIGRTDLIAHHICRVLEEPALGLRLAEAAGKKVREQYDWSVIGRLTEDILRATASGNRYRETEGMVAQWA